MNRFLIAIILMLFICGALYAGKITIDINYKPSLVEEKQDIINDNYWTVPILKPDPQLEKELYYMVIEGFESASQSDETVDLKGLSVERSFYLLQNNSRLIFKNNEKIARSFSVAHENGNIKKSVDINPNNQETYVFTLPGEYTFIDNKYPWNKIYVKVLEKSAVFPINRNAYRINITQIPAGTYRFRIFNGLKWIYMEDFTIVDNSANTASYNIRDKNVFRNDATSVTANNNLEGRKNGE